MTRSTAQRPWLRAVAPGEQAADCAEQEKEFSDAELIEAVIDGDPRIAGQIHDHLIRVIDHTLYRVFGRREHDHDDLIQTCFEQVLRTLTKKTFAGNCSLKTWAGRITTNVALNALRSRQRERRVIQTTDDPPESGPVPGRGASAEARLELDNVRRELSRMKPSRAEVLVLHDVHGYRLSEIAALMELSVSAVQSRLVRGRKELHEKLNREPSPFGRRAP
jgi:RNA polymerase sigma-70 factor (ECF subfamily)